MRQLVGSLIACGVAACSIFGTLTGLSSGEAGADAATDGPAAAEDGATTNPGDASSAGLHDAVSLIPGSDGRADTGALSAGDSSPPSVDAANDDASASPFAHLVQIYVKPILTVNTVATSQAEDSGAPIVWMDGFFGQHDFATEAEINALSPASGLVGLPSGAAFAGNGTTIPPVQLGWTYTSNVENSVLLQNDVADAGTASSLAFNVPAAKYEQLQIYVTGTHGDNGVASNLAVTLTYADQTTSASTVLVPAWDRDVTSLDAGPGEYVLVSGLAPVEQSSNLVATGFTVSIFAIDLDPTPSKSLVSVALLDIGGDPSQYAFETVVFYGATAW